MKNKILLLAALLLSVAFAGCASTDTQNVSKKEASASGTGDNEEYTYVTPTGSWLPVKVKKSAAKPTEKETQDAQDGLNELQRKGVRLPTGS